MIQAALHKFIAIETPRFLNEWTQSAVFATEWPLSEGLLGRKHALGRLAGALLV